MNISRQDLDALNLIVNIAIEKNDYQPNVEKQLTDYRKKANIPGFRKGHVPMSLIKKQYEKSVVIDEVNKLLQDELNKFIQEEKLDILGNPMPKPNESFSWEDEQFSFDFEVGLAPKFEIKLDEKNKLVRYEVEADKDFIEEEMINIRKQYGKLLTETEVSEEGNVVGVFHFDYKGKKKEKNGQFALTQFKGKANQKKFIGHKVGDVITLKTKGLFNDDHDLMHALGLDHNDAHSFDQEVTFTIQEINKSELAELNQELFDKLFGENAITTEKELRDKIKETAEQQFNNQSDQKFLNDTTDYLIESTKFDLPADFLKRWLQISGEKQMSDDEAAQEYERSEKGLRYQLIEGQIAKENNLQVTFEELRENAKNLLKVQYAQYGSDLINDEFIEGVVNKVLENQDEVRRLSEQVMNQKLLNFYKEKVTHNTKKVTYKEFVEISFN